MAENWASSVSRRFSSRVSMAVMASSSRSVSSLMRSSLVANATDYTADYVGQLQGNMILTGVAVPEPATMILFGAGMAALAFGGRRRSTFS